MHCTIAISSLPAIFFTVINELTVCISVTSYVVAELAFKMISSGWIHIPSLALWFSVRKFSVVNASISIFEHADSIECIIFSLAVKNMSIGSCLAAKTFLSPMLELSFEGNSILVNHFAKSVKTVALFHASKFAFTSVLPLILFFKTHSVVLCCHGLLCCS